MGYNERFVPNTPSGAYSGKSKIHDEMQLWLLEDENILTLIKRIHYEDVEKLGKEDFEYRIHILSQELEEPLYNGTYLVGVPDCVIMYDFEEIAYNTKLVIELKPYIESVGGVIRQTKLYANCISMSQNGSNGFKTNRPKMAVITYDENREEFELFHREGIYIARISKNSPCIQETPSIWVSRRANLADTFWKRE